MARYIDADKLLKEFEVDTSKDVMDISDIVFGAITSIIEKQPTADVVEVVRCKDCVYCDRCYPVKEINKEATEGWYCNPNRHYVKPDDFCSYGERRDT